MAEEDESHFMALMSRLKYIERWALMRSSRPENLAEHSLDVAMIAHLLCTLGNVRYGRHLDADRAAVIGLYHDASEIITGDMPTPVKYRNGVIRDAYHDVEAEAESELIDTLPEDLKPAYRCVFVPVKGEGSGEAGSKGQHAGVSQGADECRDAPAGEGQDADEGRGAAAAAYESVDADETYLWRLVKAADKLSALIKCEEELGSGSGEFATAAASTRAKIDQMAEEMPEVADFVREFLPSYGKTLDELL